MRLVGSTRANPYAATAAAIAALWGPLHGGANEAVLQTLEEIGTCRTHPGDAAPRQGQERPVPPHRASATASTRATTRAPRYCARCAARCSTRSAATTRCLTLAMELERIALEDDYFVSRKLYPNVDFYSGIIFRALGLPPAMFTPVFAVARTVGWVAHWNEMMTDPETRIVRPRQLYHRPDRAPAVADRRARGARAAGRDRMSPDTCGRRGGNVKARRGRPDRRLKAYLLSWPTTAGGRREFGLARNGAAMSKDTQGHRLSGATAVAAAAYDDAVRAFNLVNGDAIGLFDAARRGGARFRRWRIWEKPGCSPWPMTLFC